MGARVTHSFLVHIQFQTKKVQTKNVRLWLLCNSEHRSETLGVDLRKQVFQTFFTFDQEQK